MDPIIERIRKAREIKIPAGKFYLTIKRPTDLEAIAMQYGSIADAIKDIGRFVIGWDNVKESDVVPGGSDRDIKFHREIFDEWIQDMPSLWDPIVEGVLGAYKDYRTKREEETKN